MSYSHEDIWSAVCKLRQKIHNTRKAVNAVGDKAESQYTRLLGEIDRLGRRVAILEEGNRDPDARPLPEETQIQILGDFILEEIPNEVVLGGAVCDTAIRLLKAYRAALEDIVEKTRSPAPAFELIYRIREFASGTLKGKDDD